MARSTKETADLVAEFRRALRRWPSHGAVAGVVGISPEEGRADHLIGTVDFTAVHYAALADAAMERAIEHLAAADDAPRDLILQLHKARACLDFEELRANG